jgi:NAD(P)H dehydrogenase (quinone)
VAKVEQLADAHAIIFDTPTRFGNMAAQMRNFLDQTGPLWLNGALIGKSGSVFASTGTQHGGQETTITSFHSTLLHHGMIIAGVPYGESGLTNMTEISGAARRYGATTWGGKMIRGSPAKTSSRSLATRANTSRKSRASFSAS